MATSYTLYIKPTCPYCLKVLNYMNDHSIELPLVDISADEEARATLIEKGGKAQVPCLFIDGSPLYESGDIVTYLKDHFTA